MLKKLYEIVIFVNEISFNIVVAFMTAKLDENIYVIQPIKFTDGINRVCKLNITQNELKQSAHV